MFSLENKVISIIIPAYNVEKYVKKCIDSVINQTYKKLDIIIVNDGSTDNTGNILDDYAIKDNRIRIIHKENGGLPNARNRGLKYVKGDYVMFLDSDDWLEPSCCELIIKEIQNENADLVFFEYYKEFKNKSVRMQTYPHEKLLYEVNGLKEFFLYDMRTITAWGKIYDAKIIKDCVFNESLRTAEDVEFNYRVYDRVTKAIYVKTALLHYRILEKSAIHGYDSQIEEKIIPVLECLYDWSKKEKANHLEAYYSFMAIAFLLICQNGICLDSSLRLADKIKKISSLKENIYFKNLYTNLCYVKIPTSRKMLILFEKMNLFYLILFIISLKQWLEIRS